jgi:hypothetical protein
VSGKDHLAVAEDGIVIAETEDLRHFMGNEDEGIALSLEFVDDAEEIIDFLIGQGRGRFVKNEKRRGCPRT